VTELALLAGVAADPVEKVGTTAVITVLPAIVELATNSLAPVAVALGIETEAGTVPYVGAELFNMIVTPEGKTELIASPWRRFPIESMA
jgi:hypothetical protein